MGGTKSAAKANNFIVMLKVAAVFFVIIAGAFLLNQLIGSFIPEANGDYRKEGSHNALWLTGIFLTSATFLCVRGFGAVSTQAGKPLILKDVPFLLLLLPY